MAMLWEEGDWVGRRALSILSNRSTLITLRALSTLSALGGWGVLSILVHGEAFSSQLHFLAEFGDFHAVPAYFV